MAFSYQQKLVFGHVATGERSSDELHKRYKVSTQEPTVMIFKEDTAVPEVVVQVCIFFFSFFFFQLNSPPEDSSECK